MLQKGVTLAKSYGSYICQCNDKTDNTPYASNWTVWLVQ